MDQTLLTVEKFTRVGNCDGPEVLRNLTFEPCRNQKENWLASLPRTLPRKILEERLTVMIMETENESKDDSSEVTEQPRR